MLDKMLKLYQNPKRRDNFAQNERVYDAFLANLFNKFESNSNNEQFYEGVFGGLSAQCQANAKAFSNLKHLCYDLSNLLQKASDTVVQIATAFRENVNAEDATFTRLNFRTDDVVNATRRKLIGGLHEWASELLSVKKFVNDNMASFFHFKKHENLELATLMNYKMQVTAAYRKKAADLEKIKQKLYDGKDPTKWKVDVASLPEDFNDLYTSYQKIRPFMLPEVSSAGNAAGGRAGGGHFVPEQAPAVRVRQLLPQFALLHRPELQGLRPEAGPVLPAGALISPTSFGTSSLPPTPRCPWSTANRSTSSSP